MEGMEDELLINHQAAVNSSLEIAELQQTLRIEEHFIKCVSVGNEFVLFVLVRNAMIVVNMTQ
jgi:hypothetical protein